MAPITNTLLTKDMKISPTRISFTAEEAFDILHQKDQTIWRNAIDLIANYAQECYEAQFQDSAEQGSSPVEDGINFSCEEEAIFFNAT